MEAAFTQAVWCRQLRDGRARDAIEAPPIDARQFTRLAALALFGDPGQGSKVLPGLDRMGRLFADTFRALNRRAHQPHPGDLGQLIAASELIARADATTVGVWPRTSAFLARQALEQAITQLWEAQADTVGLASCPMRSQLTCLPFYLDEEIAEQVACTWAALSGACHYHPYELALAPPS